MSKFFAAIAAIAGIYCALIGIIVMIRNNSKYSEEENRDFYYNSFFIGKIGKKAAWVFFISMTLFVFAKVFAV